MSNVLLVDDASFDKEVLQADVPVLVDFGATWCGPCKRQLPILEKFATENLGKIKVVSVDTDDSPGVSSKFGIRSVPSLLLFSKGSKVDMKVGLTSATELTTFIAKVG